ncbi:hypothetical protein ACFX1T_046418 [Malus domestica]
MESHFLRAAAFGLVLAFAFVIGGNYAQESTTLVPAIMTDLSNNNLRGSILETLSQLPTLNVLNLENNNLTGSIPMVLIDRWKDGLLSLSLCENPNLSGNVSCNKKKNRKYNFFVPMIIVSVDALVSVLLLSAAAIWCRAASKRKRQLGNSTDANVTIQHGSFEPKGRQFTYSDIVQITKGFKRVLGKGGFGPVYHGHIDDTQVNLLLRVHHRNLTSLVGYCNDETNIGLIYEYMANGNLREHLSGSRSNILSWRDRLQIAIEAAQGLEYLHYGCSPPIIHRDVKSTNILLNEKFEAKLSDFGISRSFPTEDGTHITTNVAGTPGYLDPEYYASKRLNKEVMLIALGLYCWRLSQVDLFFLERMSGVALVNGSVSCFKKETFTVLLIRGLEYLHYGFKPPIIHKDVKSSNILLNESFQAKISDFYMSRNFLTEGGTHISTRVARTPGHLAPEYYLSNRLNEKSNIYSFGVVLLEIITSKHIFLSKTHYHISDWVAFLLEKGDINGILDSRFDKNFNVSFGWKALEIAMACASADATKRPTMSEVVVGLKECLATELARAKQSGNETE